MGSVCSVCYESYENPVHSMPSRPQLRNMSSLERNVVHAIRLSADEASKAAYLKTPMDLNDLIGLKVRTTPGSSVRGSTPRGSVRGSTPRGSVNPSPGSSRHGGGGGGGDGSTRGNAVTNSTSLYEVEPDTTQIHRSHSFTAQMPGAWTGPRKLDASRGIVWGGGGGCHSGPARLTIQQYYTHLETGSTLVI
jgi:hypothetical protein